MVKLIEPMLNDSDSFDHDGTLVSPAVNGRHRFTMRYRARNGFGALIVGTAKGTYGAEECSDVELTRAQ